MAETDLIRTPDQRVRVFVSSTLQDLAAERQAVRNAVTRLRLVPVMFELGARPHPPRPVYRAYAISIADLADEHLIQDPAAVPEWRDIATELCTRHRRTVPIFRTVEEKLEHVAAGHGVVLLPLSTAAFPCAPRSKSPRARGTGRVDRPLQALGRERFPSRGDVPDLSYPAARSTRRRR